MKLTKDQFCTYVAKIETMYKQESYILDALDINPEWVSGEWISNYYELVRELCEMPENDLYGTLLDYYCWEIDFGKKCTEGDELNSIENLWYAIIEEQGLPKDFGVETAGND